VKKPVSKFAFQVHNLQRYTEGKDGAAPKEAWLKPAFFTGPPVVGLCRLNQVDP
jgi:hypothetical protein